MKLVDFELAKTLQVLGYDGECIYYYRPDGTKESLVDALLGECSVIDRFPVARLDDVAYWIRDKYHISIEPVWCGTDYKWSVAAYDMDYKGIAEYFCVADNSYEDALEAAVTKAIETIKNKKQ